MELTQIKSAINTFNKGIDIVLAEPRGPRRWKAAVTLWLSLDPVNKTLNEDIILENKLYRESLLNEYGTSDDKNSGLRAAVNMPSGAYYAVLRVEPTLKDDDKKWARFLKTFPEYNTARKY